MKNILFTISLALTLIACNKETPKDYVVISGTIVNKKGDSLTVSGLTNSFSKKIGLSDQGHFIDTLIVEKTTYMIYDGSNYLYAYLEPGFELDMKYNADDIKNTVLFNGIGSEINNYLKEKKNLEQKIVGKGNNEYTLNESEFLSKIKEIQSSSLQLLSNTKNLPEDFQNIEKRDIDYQYLYKLSRYEDNHAYYNEIDTFKVSESFTKDLNGLDLNRVDDYKYSWFYTSLINYTLNKEAGKLTKSDSTLSKDVAILRTINKFVKNQNIKNILLYKNAKYGITQTSNLEDFFSAFISGSTDPENNKDIEENYTVLKKVNKGEPSPKFYNYENSVGGTSSLDDFKGKYVYIDIWATWCAPCKAEIPYLKEVEKQFYGKNIEFVNISVDKARDHDKWKKMVEEKGLKGVQLFADNNFKSQFIKDYNIKSIPKFILLDPNGKIIESNAPRPSNDKLIELFNSLKI